MTFAHAFAIFALRLPSWILIIGFMTAGAGCGFALFYPFDWLARRLGTRDQTDIAGHFLGLVGVLYAVVLAFVVVSAWQAYDHSAEVAMQEQHAVSDLFDTIDAFQAGDSTSKVQIEELLLRYVQGSEAEWEEMRLGDELCLYSNYLDEAKASCVPAGNTLSGSRITNTLVHRIWNKLPGLRQRVGSEDPFLDRVTALASDLSDAREHRRHHYIEPPLQPVMWLAFALGALVTVGMLYLVEEPSRGQRTRVIAICSMIGMMWGLALVFNHPFTGYAAIKGTQWCAMAQHFRADIDSGVIRSIDRCTTPALTVTRATSDDAD